jgi:hypothetical protein
MKGFIALRYLNEGVLYSPLEIIANPMTMKITKTMAVFLTAVLSELFFFMRVDTNKKAVLPINKIPGNPKTKDVPGLGKTNATNKIDVVNSTDTKRGFLRPFETKASTNMKIAIGITKY